MCSIYLFIAWHLLCAHDAIHTRSHWKICAPRFAVVSCLNQQQHVFTCTTMPMTIIFVFCFCAVNFQWIFLNKTKISERIFAYGKKFANIACCDFFTTHTLLAFKMYKWSENPCVCVRLRKFYFSKPNDEFHLFAFICTHLYTNKFPLTVVNQSASQYKCNRDNSFSKLWLWAIGSLIKLFILGIFFGFWQSVCLELKNKTKNKNEMITTTKMK